jgi:FKBP-type peptidyl-prolyl cis-trans isomerase
MKIVFAVLYFVCLNQIFAAEGPASHATNVSGTTVVEAWGWLVAGEKQVAGVEINEDELRAFLSGARASLKNQRPPFDLEKIFWDIQTLAEARREKVVAATTQKNAAAAEAFFGGLKKNTNVIFLPAGLAYEITKAGSGALPKPTQTVNTHFIGRLINGAEFIDLGPSDLIVVSNRFSAGLFEGIQKINAGGSIKLFVPR